MLPNWYFDIYHRYKTVLQRKSALYVALSAGVDSNTLLHWLSLFKEELPPFIPFMSIIIGMENTLTFGLILHDNAPNIMDLSIFTMTSILKIMTPED